MARKSNNNTNKSSQHKRNTNGNALKNLTKAINTVTKAVSGSAKSSTPSSNGSKATSAVKALQQAVNNVAKGATVVKAPSVPSTGRNRTMVTNSSIHKRRRPGVQPVKSNFRKTSPTTSQQSAIGKDVRKTVNKRSKEAEKEAQEYAKKIIRNRVNGYGLDYSIPSPLGGSLGEQLQADASVRSLIYNGSVDRTFVRNMEKFNNIAQKYRLTEQDLMDWAKQNSSTVQRNFVHERYNKWGKKITKLKFGSYDILNINAEPPVNLTADERKVWDYFMRYNRAKEISDIQYQQYLKEGNKDSKDSLMADYADFSAKTINSFSDIIRTFISEHTSSKFTPLEASENLFANVKTYLMQYYFNPLAQGEFGKLAMNTLVNIGETMDLPAIGVRAYLGANKTVYGTGDRIIKGQDYWVYSGGKETQKKLVDLGAYDIIKYSVGHYANDIEYKKYVNRCENAIKEAGLWDEYLKFKDEYNKMDMIGNHAGAVKEAYTSHKNYEADTGSLGSDLALEIFTDPSLIVGGVAKGLSSAGVKSITRLGVREGLSAVIKDPASLNQVLQQSDNWLKQYYRTINENIFSTSVRGRAIEENVDSIAKTLIARGVFSNVDDALAFKVITTKALKEQLDKSTYKLYLGAKLLDKSIDKVDSIGLKTVFAAPYLGYLGAKPVVKSFRNYRLIQATTRAMHDLVDVNGKTSVIHVEDYLNNLGAEGLIDEVDKELLEETFKVFQRQSAEDIGNLRSLKGSFLKGDSDVLAMREQLNNLVSQMSKGVYTDVDTFVRYLEKMHFTHLGSNSSVSKLCSRYLNELNSIIRILDSKVKETEKAFYRDLSKVNTVEDFAELYLKIGEYKTVLPSSVYADFVKLNDNFDKAVLDDIVATYERIHSTSIKKTEPLVGKVDELQLPYEAVDRVMEGKIYGNEKNELKKIDLSSAYRKNDKGYVKYKELTKLANMITEVIKDGTAHSLDELLAQFRSAKRDVVLGVGDVAEYELIENIERVLQGIVDDMLSYSVQEDMQLVYMQLDKLAVWDKYLTESNIESTLLPMFEQYSELRDIVEVLSRLQGGDAVLIKDNLSNDIIDSSKELLMELDKFKVLIDFRNQMDDLPEIERYAVMESLFGLSKGAPRDYARMSLNQRETFINKVQLWLDSVYGKSKVSLDGFSAQALDFSEELYGKYYQEIVNNPQLQQRIKKFLEGGHLDPTVDVQKQMFQVILKDPVTVEHYNSICKHQDVLFTDIETEGFNITNNALISIATKKWVEIPEDASLSDILDILENSSTTKLYQTFKSEDYIKLNVSEEILDYMFKNSPALHKGSKQAKFEAYCEKYSASANKGIEIDEAEVLDDFLRDIDKSYVNNHNVVPKLVVHNNNGFDLNFIKGRCVKNERFPIEIDHLDSIVNVSENTLARLKGLTSDSILTAESKHKIIVALESCMEKLSDYEDMCLFSPEKIANSLKGLCDFTKKLTASAGTGFDVRTLLDSNGLYKSSATRRSYDVNAELLEDTLNDLLKFDFNNNSMLHTAFEDFVSSSTDVRECMKMFNNNIIVNEFRYKVANLGDDELKLVFSDDELQVIHRALAESDLITLRKYDEKYITRYLSEKRGYSKSEIDNLMRMSKELNDSDIPPLGQRVLFDDVTVSKVFDLDDVYGTEKTLNKLDLEAMQKFSKEVTSTINKRLESTALVEPYVEEYKEFILTIKNMAAATGDLDTYNYLKYLKVPESTAEIYVVAKKLHDTFSAYISRFRNGNPKGVAYFDELYRESLYGNIDDSIFNTISDEAYSLLTLRDSNIGSEIFKDIKSEYTTQFMTDVVVDNIEWNKLKTQVDNGIKEYTAMMQWLESSEYTSLKDMATLECYTMFSELLNAVDEVFEEAKRLRKPNMVKDFLRVLERDLDHRRQIMTQQILERIISSEEDLIKHLLFNNHILNIPLKGTDVHIKQVAKLKEVLQNYNPDRIYHYEENGFLHIGIKKGNKIYDVTDYTVAKKEVKVAYKFADSDEVYFAPEYKKINVTDFGKRKVSSKQKKALDLYTQLNEKLYKLTNGASAGSVGALHTFSKQKEFYKMLPPKFIDNIVSESTSCDARLWHQASFDMSNLGDSKNCWKFGSANDIDPIKIMHENLKEVCGRASTERSIIQSIFGEDSDLLLKGNNSFWASQEEKLNTLRNLKGHTVAVLVPGKTETGFFVKELKVETLKDLELAEKANAVYLPYNVYLELEDMVNKSKVTGSLLKIASKYVAYLKCGQIMFTGTWLRNWMDATIKTIGDVGSVGEATQYQIIGMQLWNEYNKVVQYFESQAGISMKSMAAVRREFKYIPDINITFEQFEFLEGWFKYGISGGQSSLVKEVLKNNRVNLQHGYKKGSTDSAFLETTLKSGDLLGNEVEAFQDLGIEEIEKWCNTLDPAVFVKHGISKERFLEGVHNLGGLTDTEYLAWNTLAQDIAYRRAGRFVHPSVLSKSLSFMDDIVSKTLKPMSKVEEIVRLGEYLALEAQGYKKSEIFKTIVDTHFNYDNKTLKEKVIEVFIPFYTFDRANFVYWARQMSDNPRMLRYLEHIWGELSWENSSISSEERMQNDSIRRVLLSGNIPLGNSGLYLKSNPSFIAALEIIIGGPDTYFNKIVTPLQFIGKLFMGAYGVDSRALFSELYFGDLPFSIEDFKNGNVSLEEMLKVLLPSVPYVGSIYNKFSQSFEILGSNPTYKRLSESAQDGWQSLLVRMFPSVFGASFMEDYEDGWEVLSDKGPKFSWGAIQDEFRRKGKVWDANQGKFVDFDDFIPGFLNDKSLSWDEVNLYNFVLHGKTYDSNQGRYVKLGDNYISGGLNSKNNTWDELASLKYAIRGEIWDYASHSWVKVAEPTAKIVSRHKLMDLYVGLNKIVRGDKESILSKLNLIAPVFADTMIEKLGKSANVPLKDVNGKYILTGDIEHDKKVYDLIKAEVNVSTNRKGRWYNWGRHSYMRYNRRNYANGFKYRRQSILPNEVFRNARNNHRGIKSGGKVYSKPYSSGKNLAGLRMATSGYSAYDRYYSYEYDYNYKYRNPIKGVADYPQTKLGIQRYATARQDSLMRGFRNRNNLDKGSSLSMAGLSTKARLNRVKMHWWNR